ncbi:hypothetical protein PspLS_01806 [Pyricularia sp. CBS 133598]|nr:hypothetical protein PspLS_01806 [Pyricularia sp. CBS 133598]
MEATKHVERRRYLNYPDAIDRTRWEAVPKTARVRKGNNPVLKGWILTICAFLMENLRFLREMAWHNAGFGSLRNVRRVFEDYEPLFEPTVVPLPEAAEDEMTNGNDVPVEFAPQGPPTSAKQKAGRYYSAADYRALFLSGELTPTDVANALLPLIRRDTTPPGRHSIAWFDVRVDFVLRAAEESTRRYQNKESLGPLDGVPTAIKDEYDMEGYVTSHGSRNDYTGKDVDPDTGLNTNWCVRKLEEAGCVVLGKLSMHEFGLDTTGNNPVFGTPLNPHNQGYYTGGSSSGCGYAVAAGLVPFAMGSDGGGSIRIPSSLCGIVGLKPTHGRLSCLPTQNHCNTCAVLGPLAADVRTLATAYSVVGQPHPTSPFPALPPAPILLRGPSPASPSAKTLAVPTKWFSRANPSAQTLCRALIQRLVDQRGYRVVPIDLPMLTEGQIAHAIVVLTDASTLLPDTKALTPANRILLALGRTTTAVDVLLAHKLRRMLVAHLARLWRDTLGPDALILTPTTACAGWPVRDPAAELGYGLNDGDTTLASMEYVWMANFCGLPAVSVPAGFVVPEGTVGAGRPVGDGEEVEGKVPVGLMAMGEWANEDGLLRFAVDAEEVGEGLKTRPGIWEDVVELARSVKASGGQEVVA